MALFEPKRPKSLREKLISGPEEPAAGVKGPLIFPLEKPKAKLATPAAPASTAEPAAVAAEQAAPQMDRPTPPEPRAFADVLRTLRNEPLDLTPEDRKLFEEKIDALNARLEDEDKRYESSKSKAEWGEVAEIIGQAAIQLAAGADAARYNQSAAGVARPRIDWTSRFDRILKEYDSRKDTIEKQRAGVEKQLERAEGKAERQGERAQNWIWGDYTRTMDRFQQDAREAARQSAAQGADQAKLQREADAKARKIISNYELAGDAVRRLQDKEYKDAPERRQLESEVAKQLSEAGNIDAVKALQENVDESGFLLWKSKDYSKLKNYIDLNKKSGIINHYKGYGLPIPAELGGAAQPSEAPAAEPATVERAGPDGRIVIYDAKTKQPLRYK